MGGKLVASGGGESFQAQSTTTTESQYPWSPGGGVSVFLHLSPYECENILCFHFMSYADTYADI